MNGLYWVSNLGRVKNSKNKILHFSLDRDGYLHGSLWKNRKYKNVRLHRLVAQVFIPNPNNLPCVNHKDENKLNNCANNLEWCSVAYNNRYSKAKKIGQYDMKDNLIKIWNSIREAERTLGYNFECLQGCCSGKYKTAYNFKWRYL